ncbi:SNF2 domain-containing protein CLASSY 4-like [Corylus avellana]|uniref:SNF2 domain-containing protein CLASSY 4-like n=1 Tax=Corylus avellana TaxID=13451 RepID=UPI001E2068A0|nr:SNF2 domain-containing protein CLASSY 4-like [Corylus avellana]XP_059444834.1 SNF2 domain-containing protein CLASSY 4-like [Corylus avellana]
MIDYSLPVARRTRQGQALIFKQYNEHKKGKENNGAESASSSGHSRANIKIETESETVAVSDSSVEEIGVNDWGEEGSDVGVESVGLKNNQNSNVGFEGIDQVDEILVDSEEDDEVVFLGEGDMNCSSLKSGEGVVCIDVDDDDNDDDEDVLSGEDVNDPRGLNSDYVVVDSDGSETCLESSSGEEGSDDEDYKVDKLESCRESSSSEEGSDDEASDEEASDEGRGSRKRGRPKGVDVGMKRRKYGLDILFDAENEEDNINDELYCVAQRTRSHFTANLGKKKKKMDNGTFSHPLCVDEEEVVESSPGHDDDDNSDDIVGSEKFESDYENEDNFSDDESNHGGKKVQRVHVRGEGKLRMATKGKRIHLVKKGDALRILVESILEKGEVPLEELESSKDESNSAVANMGLPLKFNFGDEESKPSNKSKDQTEMDELWAELESSKDDSCKGENNSAVAKMGLPLKFNFGVEESKPSKKSKDQTEMDELWAELESSKDDACKDENYSSVAKMPLPLKFTFGVEESNPLKKSEDQKEMDELWADFELALICSEIGSAVSAKVEDALPPKNDVNRATLCQVGNHEFILDEQVGLRCAFCSYVKMEIKYILPSFSTHPCGKSDRRDPGSEMNHSIFDDLRCQDSGCDSYSVCDRPHAEATVWDIIPGIKSSMYPHQRDGFEFIWKNIAGGIYLDKLKNQTTTSGGSGCIMSHAPGTGKTRLTIVFLQTYMKLHPECRPVIVAPLGMLLTWEEEFRKWKFDIPFHNLNQSKLSGKETLTERMVASYRLKQGRYLNKLVIRSLKIYSWKQNSSILGLTYQLFGKLAGTGIGTGTGTCTSLFRKELLEVPGLVVLDEGHIPRNELSLILKALSNIKTDKRIILSGTPFQNNFDELYNTLCLVRPKFTSIRGKWESLTSPITKGTNDRLKCENLKKVRDMIDPFVHVHKGSILQEKLPGLRDSLVILQPTQLQKSLFGELHQHITRDHLNHFKSDFLNSLISVHPSLLLKCGEAGFPSERDKLEGLNHEAGVKTNFLLELIRLSNALNEKVLVFSQYLEPLTFVMDRLKFHFNWTEGNEVLYMDGRQEAKRRQSSINIFNDPTSEARVLLASTKACNEGISLVGASRVVLLDVVWNPSVETQAISRAHRLGQEKVVYIYHLIAAGTNEEDKYCRQVEKDLLSELVFSSSGGSGDQPKISPLVSDDKILEEMVQHEKLKHIFEKIQQKKSKLMEIVPSST